MTDRFTLDVIQASLTATADEMFAVLRKTAMSPIIYEVLDAGVAITDSEGNLASAGAGIPSFVGVLDKSVKKLLTLHQRDEIAPGDLFVSNDPYYGGVTHLNDVVLMMPVFAGDGLIAWAANIAHWSDIGGRVAGSMSTDAADVFQEGLRLPGVKLFERGEVIRPVLKIIEVNSRLPDFVSGDLWAGIAAARRGVQRIGDLVTSYGLDAFRTALADVYDYAERQTLSGLAKLPAGRYTIEQPQDDGEVWQAAIEIAPNSFTVDLTEGPDQLDSPYNTSRDGAVISAQMIMKTVTAPDGVANEGSFRPLRVLTRSRSRFHAEEPAPHGYYFEVRMRLFDMLWRCLAQAMPEQMPAGHFASICGTVLTGSHADHGRRYALVEPQIGGWGALPGRDGLNAMFSCVHGETFNCPAEISEARYGLEVGQITLNPEGGGEGQWRGGRGLVVDYRMRNAAQLSVGFSHSVVPPWGLAGGRDGSPNYVEIHRCNGEVSRHDFASGLPLECGDVVRLHTGNGGGWGNPCDRNPELHQQDLRNGLVEAAKVAS